MILEDADENTPGAFVFNKKEVIEDKALGLVPREWKKPRCYPELPQVKGQNFKLYR